MKRKERIFIFSYLQTVSVYPILQYGLTVLFKILTYKECERKRFWLNFLRVCTEGLRKLL